METNNRINFYARRDLGDRLSVTFRFIREHWKILLKYAALLALPFALIQGYFMFSVTDMTSIYTNDVPGMLFSVGGYLLVHLSCMVVMSAFAASLLKAYDEGRLSPAAKWKDFTHFMPFVGRTLTMVVVLIGLCVAAVIAIIILAMLPTVGLVLSMLVLFGGFIAILPPLTLVFYPLYFEGMREGRAFKKGFALGWKNWGTTFVMMLVLSILVSTISYVFAIPTYVWSFATMFGYQFDPFAGYQYVASFLASFGSYVMQPVLFIGMAFHYFACREKAEQVSVQASVANFENL